ncbi:hypothetical protein F5Y13DRAFT_192941 [Hypoxylon sp. FL1857]|nr:hypothetical protein F5Y13DRAFT_192941 [Hypoxylon sp. FL1857]
MTASFHGLDFLWRAVSVPREERLKEVEFTVPVTIPITQKVDALAAPEDLILESRKSRGLSGDVAHLFYFSVSVMPMGQFITTAVGESPNEVHWDGRFALHDPVALLYSDLPEEEAAYWAGRVVPQSTAIRETAMKRCAYTYVTSTYVVCTADNAVLPQVQEALAQMAGSVVKKNGLRTFRYAD